MRNLRKICIGVLVIAVICYASPSERKNEVVENKNRVRRNTKVTESSNESIDKQRPQKQKQSNKERSQLAPVSNNNADQLEISTNLQDSNMRLSQHMNMNSANGLMASQLRRQLQNVFTQNVMGLPNTPRQLEPFNNPYIASGLQNYANNFPYPGYQPQIQPPPQNYMGYFYGNPNIPQNGPQPMIPTQGLNNFMDQQQPLPGLFNIPAGYGNYFMGYGSFPYTQPGLPNYPGLRVDGQDHNNFLNQQGPQPGLLNGHHSNPGAYASNFMGYGALQQNQPGLQSHPGAETPTQPMNSLENNNFNEQQSPLPGSINGNQPNPDTNFIPYGSGLPNNPNLNFGPQMQHNQPQIPLQLYILHQQQQLQLNPFDSTFPYGAQPQDSFNNGFPQTPPFDGGIFPEFSRLQRSLKLKNKI